MQLCLGFDRLTAEELALGLRLYLPVPSAPAQVIAGLDLLPGQRPTLWPGRPSLPSADATEACGTTAASG